MNVDVLDKDAGTKLSKWFNDRWEGKFCIDISEELAQIIDTSWAADKLLEPFHIYLKMAYHLSREARSGISEFKLSKVFEKQLLEFQQKAVVNGDYRWYTVASGGTALPGEFNDTYLTPVLFKYHDILRVYY